MHYPRVLVHDRIPVNAFDHRYKRENWRYLTNKRSEEKKRVFPTPGLGFSVLCVACAPSMHRTLHAFFHHLNLFAIHWATASGVKRKAGGLAGTEGMPGA